MIEKPVFPANLTLEEQVRVLQANYQRNQHRSEEIIALKLEIELLKARLDECHRTIAELISTKKP